MTKDERIGNMKQRAYCGYFIWISRHKRQRDGKEQIYWLASIGKIPAVSPAAPSFGGDEAVPEEYESEETANAAAKASINQRLAQQVKANDK